VAGGDVVKVDLKASSVVMTELTQDATVKDSLNVEGHLAVGYACFQGTGDVEYTKNKTQASNKKSIVFKAFNCAYYKEFKNTTLKPGMGKDEVIKSGQYYVDRLYYGTSCMVAITISSNDASALESMDGTIHASLNLGPLKADATVKIKKFTENTKSGNSLLFRTQCYGVSMDDAVLEVDDYNEFVNEYLHASDDAIKHDPGLPVIGFTVARISDLIPKGLNLNYYLFESRLNDANSFFFEALKYKGMLAVSLERLEQELGSDPQDRQEILAPLSEHIHCMSQLMDERLKLAATYRNSSFDDIVQNTFTIDRLESALVNELFGLCGLGFLNKQETQAFFNLPRGALSMVYEGFLKKDGGKLVPVYKGELKTCDGSRPFRAGRIEELNKYFPNPKSIFTGTETCPHKLVDAPWNSGFYVDCSEHIADVGSVLTGLKLCQYNKHGLCLKIKTAKLNSDVMTRQEQPILESTSVWGKIVKPSLTNPPFDFSVNLWVHGYELKLKSGHVAVGAQLVKYFNRLALILIGAPYDPWMNTVDYSNAETVQDRHWNDDSKCFFQTNHFSLDPCTPLEELGKTFVTGGQLVKGPCAVQFKLQCTQIEWKTTPPPVSEASSNADPHLVFVRVPELPQSHLEKTGNTTATLPEVAKNEKKKVSFLTSLTESLPEYVHMATAVAAMMTVTVLVAIPLTVYPATRVCKA